MKYGYAILLSELIDSTMCNYDDCKQFQIVCPECKEPLFKVNREVDNISFFSHYKKNHHDYSDCELRVSSYNKESILQFNKESRKQSLKMFTMQFNKQLKAMSFYPNPKRIKRIIKNHSLLSFYINEGLPKEYIRKFTDTLSLDSIDGVSLDDVNIHREVTLQKKIVNDVLDMLITPKQENNFTELSALALYKLLLSCSEPDKKDIEALYQTKKLSFKSKFKGLMNYCDWYSNKVSTSKGLYGLSELVMEDTPEFTGIDYLIAQINIHIYAILFQLPYKEMLLYKDGGEWCSDRFMQVKK